MNRLLPLSRFIVFFSVVVLALPAQAAQTLDKDELRQALQKNPDILADVLKDNPNLVLDVLRANSIEMLEIAQQGSREKQYKQMLAQWERELKQTPKKINYNRPMLGNPKAPVTIVAYSDFTCHFCAQADKTTKEVLAQRQQQTRLIFKTFPKKDDQIGRLAAQYSKAAFAQDVKKGWAFNEAVFTGQAIMVKEGEAFLREAAGKVGLDISRLAADAHSPAIKAQVDEDSAEAESVGAPGTPFHLVNNLTIRGAAPLSYYLEAVDLVTKEADKKR